MALTDFILQIVAIHGQLDTSPLLFISLWFTGPMVRHPSIDLTKVLLYGKSKSMFPVPPLDLACLLLWENIWVPVVKGSN